MDNVVFSTFMGMEFENPETIFLFRIQVTLCIRNNYSQSNDLRLWDANV